MERVNFGGADTSQTHVEENLPHLPHDICDLLKSGSDFLTTRFLFNRQFPLVIFNQSLIRRQELVQKFNESGELKVSLAIELDRDGYEISLCHKGFQIQRAGLHE